MFDEFSGSLDNDGETLMLLRPSQMAPVDQVTYDIQAPWPMTVDTALELIDSNGDNSDELLGLRSVLLEAEAPTAARHDK